MQHVDHLAIYRLQRLEASLETRLAEAKWEERLGGSQGDLGLVAGVTDADRTSDFSGVSMPTDMAACIFSTWRTEAERDSTRRARARAG
jgi:hypothetical protein